MWWKFPAPYSQARGFVRVLTSHLCDAGAVSAFVTVIYAAQTGSAENAVMLEGKLAGVPLS